MSYYDDLSVAQDATPEEIRESYRTLVRLLHPDQHTDPVLKRSAEAQLRRINQSAAILADPERRRIYDAELAGKTERAAPIVIQALPAPKKTIIPFGNLAWAAAAVASAGLIFWLSSQGEPLPTLPEPGGDSQRIALPSRKLVPPTEPQRNNRPAEQALESLRRELRLANSQRDEALARLSSGARRDTTHERANPDLPTSEIPRQLDFPAIALNPEPPKLPELATEVPALARDNFAGFWVFPKSREENKDKSLYPPEFIEATISERDGTLHGRYRSRYHIYDRGISPNVNFDFEGRPSGAVAKLPWKGEGGSRGEVQIKLVSDHSMEVVWSATELGQSLALKAGTAVLMRRPD